MTTAEPAISVIRRGARLVHAAGHSRKALCCLPDNPPSPITPTEPDPECRQQLRGRNAMAAIEEIDVRTQAHFILNSR